METVLCVGSSTLIKLSMPDSAWAREARGVFAHEAPERLDLKDIHAYRARELGVPLVVSTDSHHFADLSQRRYGIAVARRAWCEPKHLINTMPLDQFFAYITTPKPERMRVFEAALTEGN